MNELLTLGSVKISQAPQFNTKQKLDFCLVHAQVDVASADDIHSDPPASAFVTPGGPAVMLQHAIIEFIKPGAVNEIPTLRQREVNGTQYA